MDPFSKFGELQRTGKEVQRIQKEIEIFEEC